MNLQEFLDSLDAELKDRRYADRLKEDLAEHIDDISTFSHLSGVANDDVILQRIGSTEEISRLYRSAMRYSNPNFLFLESVAYGALSIPLYLAMIAVGMMLIDGDGVSLNERLPNILGALFMLFVLLPAYNLFAMRNIIALHEEAGLRKQLFWMTVAPPILMFVTLLLLSFVRAGMFGSSIREFFLLAIGPVLGFAITFGEFRFLTWLITPAPATTPLGKFQRRLNIIAKWLPLVSGIVLAAYVIVTNFMVLKLFTIQGEFFNDPFLDIAVIGPRMLVEMIGWGVYLMTSFILESIFAGYLPYLLAAALFLAGLLFLSKPLVPWMLAKRGHRPSFPWLSPAALAFAAYLVFMAPTENPQIVWHIPMLDATAVIEQRQLGPLYRIVKYFNRNEGHFARYWAGDLNDGFTIAQKDGPAYVVNLQGELDADDLSATDPIQGLGAMMPLPVPDGVTCNGDVITSEVRSDGQVTLYRNGNGDLSIGCGSLAYNGRPIADIQGGGFAGMRLSQDGQYAAILVSTGYYDPSYVYLVDLR